jgi:hypothetical protein
MDCRTEWTMCALKLVSVSPAQRCVGAAGNCEHFTSWCDEKLPERNLIVLLPGSGGIGSGFRLCDSARKRDC